MKNVIKLETHDEILNAYMSGEYPELALVIARKSPKMSEYEANYEIGKYYSSKGIYAGELKKKDGFYGIFVALSDYGANDDECSLDWSEAMDIKFSQDNIHVPDIRELSLIQLNIDDINAGLEEAGGEKLEGYYWSSTEYDSYNAWRVDLSSGSRYNGNKYTTSFYVRPVLALKL